MMKSRCLQQKAGAEKQARRSLYGAGVNVKAWKDLEPLEDGVPRSPLAHQLGGGEGLPSAWSGW